MTLLKQYILRCYFSIFNLITSNYKIKNGNELRQIHSVLIFLIVSAPILTAYVINFFLHMENKIPALVGLITSSIHLSLPLLYLLTRNSLLIGTIALSGSFVFLSTFLIFEGGISNPLVIWFGIFPLFPGTICERNIIMKWIYISLAFIITFSFLSYFSFTFQESLTNRGKEINQMILIFGILIINITVILVYKSLQQRTEQELHRQNSRADDLFRVLFHDLANPLGRMSIGLSIAKRAMPDMTHRGIEIASQASDNMMKITKNIRKMYAISRGKANIEISYTSLKKSLDLIQEYFKSDLEKKRINLHFNIFDSQDVYLLVDNESFKHQVLGNILSNAVRFSPPGSNIWIKIFSANEHLFVLEIQDEGIGIPETLKDHLFDLNKKTTRPGTDGDTGTGLGLHIVKSFVEAFGGEISVSSRVTKDVGPSGTTIKLILHGERRIS